MGHFLINLKINLVFWFFFVCPYLSAKEQITKIQEIEKNIADSSEIIGYLINTNKIREIDLNNFRVNISSYSAYTSFSGKTKYLLFIAKIYGEEDKFIINIAGAYFPYSKTVKIFGGQSIGDIKLKRFVLSKIKDYVLFEGSCNDYYDCLSVMKSELFEFDEKQLMFNKIFDFPLFEHVQGDGCDSTTNYIDRAEIKEGEWIEGGLREVIVNIKREDIGSNPPERIKEITEKYSWKNGKIYLIEKFENKQKILSKESAEKLLIVSELCKTSNTEHFINLIYFLGEENQIVRENAYHCLYSLSLVKGESFDKLINILITKALDNNWPGKESARSLLYSWASFNNFFLNETNKNLVWEILNREKTDDLWLRILVYQKDMRVLPVLTEMIYKATEENNGCLADMYYVYLYNLIDGNSKMLSPDIVRILKKAIQTGLICKDYEYEINVSVKIAEWLATQHLKLPEECSSREKFPDSINKRIPLKENFSGLLFIHSLSEEECQTPSEEGHVCFSKEEIENIMLENFLQTGDWVDAELDKLKRAITGQAFFGFRYCRLESDYAKLMRDSEEKAISLSRYEQQKEMREFLLTILGEWCGVTYSKYRDETQLRIIFVQDKKIIKGIGTITYYKIGDYVVDIILIPMAYDEYQQSAVKKVTLSEITKYGSEKFWSLRWKDRNIIIIYNEHWGEFILKKSCDGFWKKKD